MARSQVASPSSSPASVSGIVCVPPVPSSGRPRMGGLTRPSVSIVRSASSRPWRDSTWPMPASICQSTSQAGVIEEDADAAARYAS